MERIKKALQQARAQREQRELSANKYDDRFTSALQAVSDENKKASKKIINDIVTTFISTDDQILEKNKILYVDTPLAIQRAYKMLRTRFLQRIVQNDWNAIAVVSPTSNDGKTLTAINLCISIAQDPNHTSLLVDFDLLQPSLYKYFEFEPEISVSDCLTENVPLEKCLLTSNQKGFVMAPAKQAIEGSSEMLASKTAVKFSKEIKLKYYDRVILYDLPPILMCDDALSFLPNVDAVLLILREGKTKRSDVEATINMLDGKPIAGVVLNDSKYGISDYYY